MVPLFVTAIFYVTNFAYLYLWLLPRIGFRISTKCHNIWSCSRHLKEIWLHYRIDTADGQWREFRGSLWLLWICVTVSAITYFCIRKLCERDLGVFFNKSQRVTLHMISRLIFGVFFLFVQHGYHSFIVILLASISFVLAKFLRRAKFYVLAVWIYAIFILLLKESYRIKHYPTFSLLRPMFDSSYGGLYRWQLPANFLILRLISFSLDYRRACIDDDSRDLEKVEVSNPDNVRQLSNVAPALSTTATASQLSIPAHPCPYLLRESKVESYLPVLSDYSFLNFFVYVLYAPLYMAGPIITFDDFVRSSQGEKEKESDSSKDRNGNQTLKEKSSIFWIYGCRWLLCFLLMEMLSSFFPIFAVINSGLFYNLSVAEMAAAAYLTLKLMWLKFLLLWRFFRLWALADGITAPENMLRCVANNYSLEQFWKGWHASFNKWLIAYLYLPLGGRNNRLLSVWAVFFFVAVWHDIDIKLLMWGALNSVFYIVEILAKRVAQTQQMQRLPPSLIHLIGSVSGGLYIMVLFAVNLLGYAVGVDGLSSMGNKLMTSEGIKVLFVTLYFMTVSTSFLILLEQWRNPTSDAAAKNTLHHVKNKGD